MTQGISLGGHASCRVVGGCGGSCIRRAVGLGHRDLPPGEIVLVLGDVAALIGVRNDVVAEVEDPGGFRAIGIVGLNEAVEGIVLVLRSETPRASVSLVLLPLPS